MRLREFVTAAALLLAACGSDQQETTAEAGAADGAADDAVSAEEAAAVEHNAADRLQPVDNAAQTGPANGAPGGQASDDSSMEWNFSRAAGQPKLAFGVPQTDNVRLILRCPESGQALLSFLRRTDAEDRPGTLAIASGGAQRTLNIETEQGPLGTTVRADVPLSAAPLQQFRSGKGLEVRWGEETINVPGAADGPVRQFFDACG